jgi:hypothetical protein
MAPGVCAALYVGPADQRDLMKSTLRGWLWHLAVRDADATNSAETGRTAQFQGEHFTDDAFRRLGQVSPLTPNICRSYSRMPQPRATRQGRCWAPRALSTTIQSRTSARPLLTTHAVDRHPLPVGGNRPTCLRSMAAPCSIAYRLSMVDGASQSSLCSGAYLRRLRPTIARRQ